VVLSRLRLAAGVRAEFDQDASTVCAAGHKARTRHGVATGVADCAGRCIVVDRITRAHCRSSKNPDLASADVAHVAISGILGDFGANRYVADGDAEEAGADTEDNTLVRRALTNCQTEADAGNCLADARLRIEVAAPMLPGVGAESPVS
jgi:hypothetical protein